MSYTRPLLAALASIAVFAPPVAYAEQGVSKANPIIATEVFEGTRIAFKPGAEYFNSLLVITGPENYQAEIFAGDSLPSIPLEKFGKLTDGIYSYHMTAATPEFKEIINPGLNNGRDDIEGAGKTRISYRKTATASRVSVGAEISGQFCVKDGVIVPMEDLPEEKAQQRKGG